MSEGLVQPCLSCSAFKIMSAHDVPLEQDHIRLALLKTIQRLSSVRRLAHGPLRTDRGPACQMIIHQSAAADGEYVNGTWRQKGHPHATKT